MAIAFVQENDKNAASVASTTLTLGTVTAGNFIYVAVTLSIISTTCTVTDNLGNTYTQIDEHDSTSNSLWSFYAQNITGGACTLTITPGATATIRCGAAEYSGVDQSSPIDVHAANQGTSATVSVSMTTSFPNPLLILNTRWSTVQTFSPNGGYTTLGFQPTAGALWAFAGNISSDLAGSETATASLGASATWDAQLVAIKPAQAQTPIALVPNTRYRIYEYSYQC